jgi:hypothetical protein
MAMRRYGYVSGISLKGEVDATNEIESAADAHALFVDANADNSELEWRMEVKHNGGGAFLRWHRGRDR